METQATAGFWLSPQQKHAWSLQQESSSANAACLVFLDGAVDTARLKRSLEQLVARHEILRTIYRRQTGMKIPFQIVLETSEPAFEAITLSPGTNALNQQVEELFQKFLSHKFDIEKGPVVFAALVRLKDDQSALVLAVPALCADKQSLQNLVADLARFYSDTHEAEADEPLRYVQFAQWQNDLLESEEDSARQGRGFWTAASDAAAIVIPCETRGEDGDAFLPNSFTVEYSDAAKLDTLASKLDPSLSNVLLAAWQSLLWRLSGQTIFVTGVGFDGREYEELQNAVGPFQRILPIQARFDGDFRFREVVARLSDSIAKAAEWQEYFVPGSSAGIGAPVIFEFAELSTPQPHVNVKFSLKRAYVCAERFRLKLSAVRHADGLRMEWHYDASRFAPAVVERMAGYFQTLLTAALENPETLVSRLPLLNPSERQQLLGDWNRTESDYPNKCLQQLFEAQAVRTPDRPALRFEQTELSYRQLNEQANRLAHHLRSQGVKPDSLVGLCVERSAEMMVAVLAILKAGGAYVPLNPDNPKPRLAQQLAGAVVLITENKLLAQMPEFAGKTLCLDRDQALWANQPVSNPAVNTTPENLAYVIYTSGSTGVPKGVGVRHRNLVNYSHFITQRLELNQHPDGLHFATVSTLGADLGNTCIYPSLISGGCLHVIPYEVSTDAQRFAAYAKQHPIDVLKIVPSHLQALLHGADAEAVLPRKFLITGGETLTPKLLEKIESLNPACQVMNHYGPTETTVGSLTLRMKDYDWKQAQATSVPIGRPIANTQIYILDTNQQPVPIGVIGELYIAGAGVTAGYLNQPERTAERFLPNPFAKDANARMYRTGDLARYHEDGNVEFLGRGDDQVKIRGFRIELGEIEAVLAKRSGVKQAVVLAQEDANGEKRLVAYVVSDREASLTSEQLKAYLKEQLPDYMVPSAIALLPKLPLTSNGKIDRQALPAPEQLQTRAYVAPKTPTEEAVAGIWAEVLRRQPISTEDNFFDLGGHSLLATQVISRIREQFRVDLPLRTLFEKPTVCELAEAISSAGESDDGSSEAILPVSREAYRAGRS